MDAERSRSMDTEYKIGDIVRVIGFPHLEGKEFMIITQVYNHIVKVMDAERSRSKEEKEEETYLVFTGNLRPLYRDKA